MKKFKEWIKAVSVKVVKTMAEIAIGLIGTSAIGITDVDWIGVLSACALSGVVTILFNLKALPVPKGAEAGDTE